MRGSRARQHEPPVPAAAAQLVVQLEREQPVLVLKSTPRQSRNGAPPESSPCGGLGSADTPIGSWSVPFGTTRTCRSSTISSAIASPAPCSEMNTTASATAMVRAVASRYSCHYA